MKKLSEDYDGRHLVFIIGAARSGTTHLQNLLASHPLIKIGQETHLFNRYVGSALRSWDRHLDSGMRGLGVLGLPSYFDEITFLKLTKKYTLSLLEPMISNLKDGEIFLEKTPDHLRYVREILRLLPASRFIYILRDGRDVVASLLAASRTFGRRWAPKKARDAAILWRDAVEAGLEAKKEVKPEQFHEVRFEDLITSPQLVLRKTIEFLGMDWSDQEIQEAVEANSVEKAQKSRKLEYSRLFNPKGELGRRTTDSGPPREDAFIRQGRPGSWKKDLGLLDKLRVWLVLRKSLSQVGYDR